MRIVVSSNCVTFAEITNKIDQMDLVVVNFKFIYLLSLNVSLVCLLCDYKACLPKVNQCLLGIK